MYLEGILSDAGLDERAIKGIMEMLDESAVAIDGRRLRSLAQSAFGGSATGGELGNHTSIAHDHVVAALTELAEGMKGYRENVGRWHSDFVFTDEEQGALLDSIRRNEVCTSRRDFRRSSPAPVCAPPADTTEGGDA